jgi:hydroxymethylpyrimidine/phosphomethylpyrimidine kinase
MNPCVVLTIAGSDSGGAAGIAADLATFAGLGAHGACVVTAVTAQDTLGVRDIHPVPLATVSAQLDAVLEDLPVSAAKTGMLGSPEVVRLVADRLRGRLLVFNPPLVPTTGAELGGPEVCRAYLEHLIPAATVITPNVDEARALLAVDDPPCELARGLAGLGSAAVVTGGPGPDRAVAGCTDWVAMPGQEPVPLTHPTVATDNDHGTGCTFSAALAVHLARAVPLPAAVRRAAAYTTHQLTMSATWRLGRGRGPIAHLRGDR